MMMMFYRRRASPKHRYDMIEVDYGGEGHRTWLRDQEINGCVYGVPPSPVYKGVEEGEGWPSMARPRGVLLPPGVGFPPSLVGLGEKEGGEREEGKGGPAPPNSDWAWGACPLPCSFPLLSTKAQ